VADLFEWTEPTSTDPIRTVFPLAAESFIECAAWGPPPSQAPTLMLLHEGLGCIELWRGFPSLLSQATGCGVFTYSRLGHGNSSILTLPQPLTRMADEARNVLPALIDAIEPEKLILVGHSDGGTIAAHYLAGDTHPALKAAVLMSAHFSCDPSNVAAIRDASAAYAKGDLRKRLAKYHTNVDAAFYGWSSTWLDSEFSSWQMSDEIERWRHPVLFAQGRDDPYGSEAQAEAAARSRHAEIHWLDNCAHNPHLEKSEEMLRLISNFVSKAIADAEGTR
jgi:pimeloyl-ACP methyl ester carboxylesterase